MKITEIADYESFLTLEEKWKEILGPSNHTVFQTWDWLSTWWKHFGKDRRLLILLAEESEGIIGIAPLMCSVYRISGIRRKIVEFIGSQHSGYNSFIVKPGNEECINQFIEYLNNTNLRWNYAQLEDIPENFAGLNVLSNISEVAPAHQSFYTCLPNSTDQLLDWINRKDRKELKRNVRRLEDDNLKPNLADYSIPN